EPPGRAPARADFLRLQASGGGGRAGNWGCGSVAVYHRDVDFVRPHRSVSMSFVAGKGHYDTVIRAVREAKTSVWIATANLKELMVEDNRWLSRRRRAGRPGYRSVIGVFGELSVSGVELRILHASPPSRPFREELRRHP